MISIILICSLQLLENILSILFFQMQINGKPIVRLPAKKVTLTDLEFTEEEKAIYSTYETEVGRTVILVNSKVAYFPENDCVNRDTFIYI